MTRAIPLLGLILAFAGCARDDTRYPSLMPRAIESRSDADPAEAPAVATADPALDAQITAQQQALAKAAADFAVATATADRMTRAATGAAPGSDAWLDAQTALGGLDDARGSTQAVVEALEAAAIDRATRLLPPYAALDSAKQAASAQAQEEAGTIARLQARLKPAG